MKSRLSIRLHPDDDVVIARDNLDSKCPVDGENVVTRDSIPAGHKIATRDIEAGEPVRRYGQIIGLASEKIRRGQHVHEHNLKMANFSRDYRYCAELRPTKYVERQQTFDGIVRANGRAATRNYIGILTSVNCAATVARGIADHFNNEKLKKYANVDGVVALAVNGGCCIDSKGEGLALLRRTLAGYARHPNFAGVLMVGLGCETNQISGICSKHALFESDSFRTFTIQDSGGTTNSVRMGIGIVEEMLPKADQVVREPIPASELTVALQCGGSDGYSGISANPALGVAVDKLVRHGGTAVLSETPEIYGAEHLLTQRAVSKEVGEKLISRIKWWEDYTKRNHGEMNNNPTAGNKAGGLTTILEKSLGAVAKAGSTNLMEVYEYAETIKASGFVFMDGPGYDPVSITGEVAGGSNLVCFTTGRGSAYGCAPSPSLKLSTNTALWKRQEDDIDLNCGGIVDGTISVEQVGKQIFRLMLDTASGAKSKSEIHGYGQNEFNPWQIGAIM